jgi:hypothetical protein
MSQRFRFTLKGVLLEIGLIAFSLNSLRLIGSASGWLESFMFIELAAVAFGAAVGGLVGVHWQRQYICALVGAVLAMPIAICAVPFVWVLLEIIQRIK